MNGAIEFEGRRNDTPTSSPHAQNGSVQPERSCASKVRFVTHASGIKEMLEQLKGTNMVAIDCEGDLSGRNPQISLIQVAAPSAIYLLDMLAEGQAMMDGGLRDLLESSGVLKVLHDCRNDSNALWVQYGCFVNPIFDTQGMPFCFASTWFLPLSPSPLHLLVGHDELSGARSQIGLNAMLQQYVDATNPLKDIIKSRFRADAGYWFQRPLDPEAIQYAAYDVKYLLPAALAMQSLQPVKLQSILISSRRYADLCRRPLSRNAALPMDGAEQEAAGEFAASPPQCT